MRARKPRRRCEELRREARRLLLDHRAVTSKAGRRTPDARGALREIARARLAPHRHLQRFCRRSPADRDRRRAPVREGIDHRAGRQGPVGTRWSRRTSSRESRARDQRERRPPRAVPRRSTQRENSRSQPPTSSGGNGRPSWRPIAPRTLLAARCARRAPSSCGPTRGLPGGIDEAERAGEPEAIDVLVLFWRDAELQPRRALATMDELRVLKAVSEGAAVERDATVDDLLGAGIPAGEPRPPLLRGGEGRVRLSLSTQPPG